MKKFKSLMMAVLCSIILIGTSVPTEYALATGTTSGTASENGKIPTISMGDDGLDIGSIAQQEGDANVFNTILDKYGGIVTFISGIALISMILFFILNLINLGNSKGNPQERQKAITGLIVSGIATAGLGSVTLITALFYNGFNSY